MTEARTHNSTSVDDTLARFSKKSRIFLKIYPVAIITFIAKSEARKPVNLRQYYVDKLRFNLRKARKYGDIPQPGRSGHIPEIAVERRSGGGVIRSA